MFFHIYGEEGIIFGQCLSEAGDTLKLTNHKSTVDIRLTGQWLTMVSLALADLMIAIEQDREP